MRVAGKHLSTLRPRNRTAECLALMDLADMWGDASEIVLHDALTVGNSAPLVLRFVDFHQMVAEVCGDQTALSAFVRYGRCCDNLKELKRLGLLAF